MKDRNHNLNQKDKINEIELLVLKAKHGNSESFNKLYQIYRPRIFALALHLSGHQSDAEDITQNVFLKAFQYLPSFEGRSQFFTWLYRITLHQVYNKRRKTKKHLASSFDDPRVTAAIATDSHGDAYKALELQESYSLLMKSFDSLSIKLKQTVALTILQGLSHQEAAIILKVSEGTISWRIHEARKLMHEFIQKYPSKNQDKKIITVKKSLHLDEIIKLLKEPLLNLNYET